jgi:hypothetical protein
LQTEIAFSNEGSHPPLGKEVGERKRQGKDPGKLKQRFGHV